MEQIRQQEFKKSRRLDELEQDDRLEILYYHPGYITPEEFFIEMHLSILRLKHRKRKLTVLFNSLDQLGGRFPLCAKQEIFVPGIIEALSGEGATSIFIAVDEPGQPVEQYGLLPMADLILSFYPYRFTFEGYYSHLNAARGLAEEKGAFKDRIGQGLETEKSTHRDEIVLKVVRFAGGQRRVHKASLNWPTAKDPPSWRSEGCTSPDLVLSLIRASRLVQMAAGSEGQRKRLARDDGHHLSQPRRLTGGPLVPGPGRDSDGRADQAERRIVYADPATTPPTASNNNGHLSRYSGPRRDLRRLRRLL